MLPPIFGEQGLPEPSGDRAAGVTSWKANLGTCFSWRPPGDCIPPTPKHIFPRFRCETSGARVARSGEPPRAPGVTWEAGLVSGCCVPRILPRAGLLCLPTVPRGQVAHGHTWLRDAWAWFGLRVVNGKGYQKGAGAEKGEGQVQNAGGRCNQRWCLRGPLGGSQVQNTLQGGCRGLKKPPSHPFPVTSLVLGCRLSGLL